MNKVTKINLKKAIVGFILIKITATFVMFFLNYDVINAHDTFSYWDGAKKLKNIYYNNKTILHNILYDIKALKYYEYPYEFTKDFRFDFEEHEVEGLRTVFFYLPLAFMGIKKYFVANFISVIISLFWIIYVIKILYPKYKWLAFVPIMEPNSLLWTSAISKELLLFPAFWFLIALIIIKKDINFPDFILAILSVIIILLLRPFLIIAPILLASLLFLFKQKISIQITVITFSLILLLIFRQEIAGKIYNILDTLRWNYLYAYDIPGIKALPFLGIYDIEVLELLKLLPLVLYNSFFAPAFLFGKSWIWNASAVYNTILVLGILYVLIRKRIYVSTKAVLLILISVFLGIAVGLYAPALGTMLRYKIFHFSMFLFGFILLYYKTEPE